jgi:hypothetical protein
LSGWPEVLAVACGHSNQAITGLDDECARELDVSRHALDDTTRRVDADVLAEGVRALSPRRDDRLEVSGDEVVERLERSLGERMSVGVPVFLTDSGSCWR